MTLLTAAECRDKAEQKMVEAMNAADPRQHHELEATAKAWLELADKIEQAEALEALKAKGK
jgi:Holliday junction resolvase-like predicted endonuclease